MIRILLVDDHTVVTQGLRLLLQDVTDIAIIGEARNGQEVLDIIAKSAADVVLMDIEMTLMDVIKCTGLMQQRYPEVKVIAISIYADYPHVQAMIKA